MISTLKITSNRPEPASNSPRYWLNISNMLFQAAKKKKQNT